MLLIIRGGACGFNSFDFSSDKSYYTMTCNGPHVPQEYLFQAPNKKVATLVTNAFLSNSLAQKHLPKISNLVRMRKLIVTIKF